MTPERWCEVETMYQATMDRDPEVRSAYLVEACRGDEDLRRDVESLLELNGLPHANRAAGFQDTGFPVETDDTMDQEVAVVERFLIFIQRNPDMNTIIHQNSIAIRQKFVDFLQANHGRGASQLIDHVAVGFRDDKRFTDRSTPLRDDRPDLWTPANHDTDRAFIDGTIIEE